MPAGCSTAAVMTALSYGRGSGGRSKIYTGHPLSSSATWDSKNFSTLGLTPDTYVWTWGAAPGASDDSFTLNIAVPEPSSIALIVLPLALVMLLAARRATRNSLLF